MLFTSPYNREIAPVVDARSAAKFLRHNPGVTDVVGYKMTPDETVILMPGTVDGPTAEAINAVLNVGAQDGAMPIAMARPADAKLTFGEQGQPPPTVPLD